MNIDRSIEIKSYAKRIMPELVAKFNELSDNDKYILELFAKAFEITKYHIFMDRRFGILVDIRHLIRYFYRENLPREVYTLTRLGYMHTLTHQDHTTVVNSIKRGKNLLMYDFYSDRYNEVVRRYHNEPNPYGSTTPISNFNQDEHYKLCEVRSKAF